jgi:8-oxo-dGTP pyrophosphatase MutT (NUDIX family)
VKTAPSNRQVVDFAQVAALPLLVGDDGVARVLLLTSRETKRWVAAQEALEEAGVSGRAWKKPVGAYSYFKRRDRHFDICQVDVYLLRVEKQLKTWAEKDQREARWFTLEEAADLVQEPGLAALLRDLARTGLGKGFPEQTEPSGMTLDRSGRV